MSNGLIVRDLPRRLIGLGFVRVDVAPQVRLSRQPDAAFTWLVEPAVRELARTGALTPAEAEVFLADLHERAATGRYFLARTFHSVVALTG